MQIKVERTNEPQGIVYSNTSLSPGLYRVVDEKDEIYLLVTNSVRLYINVTIQFMELASMVWFSNPYRLQKVEDYEFVLRIGK